MFSSLVSGDGKCAAVALANARRLENRSHYGRSSTLCGWPRIPTPEESMDDGFAACVETFPDDEFHAVGSNDEGVAVAVRRVIRGVDDEDVFRKGAPILGRPNFGTELYLGVLGRECGQIFIVSSPRGIPKARGKKALLRRRGSS